MTQPDAAAEPAPTSVIPIARDTRLQYFLTYAVLGSTVPFISVLFRKAGLSSGQVGFAWSVWSLAAVLSPVFVTRVADGSADPRRLLSLASAATAVCLLSLG